MTNAVITWIETELGTLKTEAVTIEPAVIAWAKKFLSDMKPVVIQAANDAVLAAVAIPGGGSAKFTAAVETAGADLLSQGVPIADNVLKAAVQIAYNALPDDVKASSAAQAVDAAANAAVDNAAAKVAVKQRSFRLLLALSLLLTQSCPDTPASSCPPPVWPDACTTTMWLISTPHPGCVAAWKDRYARQQCLLGRKTTAGNDA
jgi:hypothetical protein